jgi:hypothetical protein
MNPLGARRLPEKCRRAWTETTKELETEPMSACACDAGLTSDGHRVEPTGGVVENRMIG